MVYATTLEVLLRQKHSFFGPLSMP